MRWADDPVERVVIHADKMPAGRAPNGVELLFQSRARREYRRKAQSCHVPVVLEQAPDVEVLVVQDVHELLSDAERVRPGPPPQLGVGKQIEVLERDGAIALQMLEEVVAFAAHTQRILCQADA